MRGRAHQRAKWFRTRCKAVVKFLSRASIFYESQTDSFANRNQSNLHYTLTLKHTFWIIFRKFR